MFALILMMVLEHLVDSIDIIWWPKGVAIICLSALIEGGIRYEGNRRAKE